MLIVNNYDDKNNEFLLSKKTKKKSRFKDEKIQNKEIKKKLKRLKQYPNRSDYRLLLRIKPISFIHDLYQGLYKSVLYADKAGTLYQFVVKQKNKNKKENINYEN